MAVKAFEKPKGSGIWWLSINHQGYKWSKKFGTDKQLVHNLEARGNAAISRGSDDLGVQQAVTFVLLDYIALSRLPVHERRLQTFCLIPGGRSD